MKVALQASEIFGVKRDCLHLDSSSFHVHGAYLRKETIDPEGKVLEKPIIITHGYSQDHRPDLKQFIVNLMCSGDGDVPLYLKVADAALYSVDNIESLANLKWVSRVPATIKDAEQLMAKVSEEAFISSTLEGYKIACICNTYGGIRQRWLVVESQARLKSDLKQQLRIFLTILLILFVVYMFFGKIKKTSNERIQRLSEIALTILYLHLSFLFFFYGASQSWTSYSYLIVVGFSLIASRNIRQLKDLRFFILSFAIVIAMLGYKMTIKNMLLDWHTMRPQQSLAGLWADEAGKKELTDLIKSCKAKNTLIFGPGAVDLLFPPCHMPASFYPVTNANLNDRDLARINKQFDQAQQVVGLTSGYPSITITTNIHKLKQDFAKFEFDHKDKMFTYLRRKN